ncbi:DUF3850 domain-containing protein [Vibrio scophthalmi]|uniref:Gp91 n=1 Tax=Vibrio scophthalmi LMG 19158 TaxID=870967 RepID=F9RKV1_9VIBR|nr:DUF3850 domain-containing protein [Vibrio scophthalmi]EGU39425.1 gp91 [Vibrio scophthalmi LMG 19158]
MSTFKLHELKIQSHYFTEVLAGRKTCEVRFNDRDYQVGDCLNLREIGAKGEYTGQEMNIQISHVLQGGQFGIADGWCVLSLENGAITTAISLVGYLRDRLQETCDCIDAGHEIIREAGYTIDDSQMTVEGGREFIEIANKHLAALGEDSE